MTSMNGSVSPLHNLTDFQSHIKRRKRPHISQLSDPFDQARYLKIIPLENQPHFKTMINKFEASFQRLAENESISEELLLQIYEEKLNEVLVDVYGFSSVPSSSGHSGDQKNGKLHMPKLYCVKKSSIAVLEDSRMLGGFEEEDSEVVKPLDEDSKEDDESEEDSEEVQEQEEEEAQEQEEEEEEEKDLKKKQEQEQERGFEEDFDKGLNEEKGLEKQALKDRIHETSKQPKKETTKGLLEGTITKEGSTKRSSISRDSRILLETIFSKKRAPNSKERLAIAEKCGLSPLQVRVWFTNKRMRSKGAK